jgi:hypothetical protein
MVSRFSGYIVLGVGVVGVEHKQKLELRLGYSGLVLDLRLRNVLIAGSFG